MRVQHMPPSICAGAYCAKTSEEKDAPEDEVLDDGELPQHFPLVQPEHARVHLLVYLWIVADKSEYEPTTHPQTPVRLSIRSHVHQ